jgi:hypothetical protein
VYLHYWLEMKTKQAIWEKKFKYERNKFEPFPHSFVFRRTLEFFVCTRITDLR